MADAEQARTWEALGFLLWTTVEVRVGDSRIVVDPVEESVIRFGDGERGVVEFDNWRTDV